MKTLTPEQELREEQYRMYPNTRPTRPPEEVRELIAQRDELLAAAKWAFDEACRDNTNQPLIDALDAAIAKCEAQP